MIPTDLIRGRVVLPWQKPPSPAASPDPDIRVFDPIRHRNNYFHGLTSVGAGVTRHLNLTTFQDASLAATFSDLRPAGDRGIVTEVMIQPYTGPSTVMTMADAVLITFLVLKNGVPATSSFSRLNATWWGFYRDVGNFVQSARTWLPLFLTFEKGDRLGFEIINGSGIDMNMNLAVCGWYY